MGGGSWYRDTHDLKTDALGPIHRFGIASRIERIRVELLALNQGIL